MACKSSKTRKPSIYAKRLAAKAHGVAATYGVFKRNPNRMNWPPYVRVALVWFKNTTAGTKVSVDAGPASNGECTPVIRHERRITPAPAIALFAYHCATRKRMTCLLPKGL
jgi:hypothetical protein